MSRPLPQPAPGSLVITTHSTGPIASAVVLAVAGALAIVGLATTTWVLAAIAAAVFALGAVVLRKPLEALLRWRRPELILPASTMPMGATLELIYRRQSRKIVDVSSCRVTFELKCTERATYQRGTDTTTDTSKVFSEKYVADAQATPWGFQAAVVIETPLHAGAPTMDLGNNEIEWEIETEALGATVPSDNHNFEVVVSPAVGSSARIGHGVQDT